MKRRNFIKNIGLASAAPAMLGGIPVQSFAQENLKKLLGDDNDNKRVLVLIQLHGGNDGLNTLIPVGKYAEYLNRRANIAIPKDESRRYIVLNSDDPEENHAGVHPDMEPVKQMYDQGRMSAIQAVGYENMNMSHFRGRDILFMGGSYNEIKDSSWLGRFLDSKYPGYPDKYPNDDMLDPLGLELNNKVSLAFQRSNSIPAGISLNNPDAFYNLINGTTIDKTIETSFPDNYYGEELKYLNQFELKTEQYSDRLKEVYDEGKNAEGVNYPTSYPLVTPTPYRKNHLSGQLKIIARLLSGGKKLNDSFKTRIFIARIGGFDTHAQQVDPKDATMGRHAALLYHLTHSIKAFHDDLKAQGLEDRVLTMTFSEFGRRVPSNASYGTDHGKAFPVLMFGPWLKRKIHGPNPDLSKSNLDPEFDYREIYARILKDWLGASNESIIKSGFGDYMDSKLGDLFRSALSTDDVFNHHQTHELDNCWPNPVQGNVKFRYHLAESEDVRFRIFNSAGQMIQELVNRHQTAGTHEVSTDLSELKPGNYIYRLQTSKKMLSKILLISK